MGKSVWKPGTVVYPVPAVMVSCGDIDGEKNIITVAWTGTINTNPPMTYVSIRPERHSYEMIKKSGEFVINLVTEKLAYACDYCGVRSGKDVDKFKEMKLTAVKGNEVSSPLIYESPVNIECKVKDIVELGSHHMFIGEVVSVSVSDEYMDETGKFHFNKSKPICYSHGGYFGLGKQLGTFGYSVKKQDNKKENSPKKERWRKTGRKNIKKKK